MRQTGTLTFSISDGADPTNVWSSDFRLHGWLDDLYGAAAVSVFDPEDRELELGHEMVYQAEGQGEKKGGKGGLVGELVLERVDWLAYL